MVKIETDPNPALVEKYGIYGLPTVMIFKGGAAVEGSKREGALRRAPPAGGTPAGTRTCPVGPPQPL